MNIRNIFKKLKANNEELARPGKVVYVTKELARLARPEKVVYALSPEEEIRIENCVNPEVLNSLKQLLTFAEELCVDVHISKHYPSMEKARYIIKKYESMLSENKIGG